VIRAQHLTEKDPQRDQRRINPIHPINIDRRQSVRHDRLGQHRAKRQASILAKLTPQKTRLLPKPSLVRISHSGASLPVMVVVRNTICAGEALFAYLSLNQRLAGKLRTIRRCDFGA
jgi:hypothetical protein